MMKIGVMPHSFRVPFKEAVILAMGMGAKGLQPVVRLKEEINQTLSKDERKAVLKYFTNNGLVCAEVYDGYLTIEREVGENPTADIKLAHDYLADCLKKIY